MKWVTNKWPIVGGELSKNLSPPPRWQDWCGGAMLAMMVLASLIMMIWSLPAPGLADNWPREQARSVLHTPGASAKSVCSLERDNASQEILRHC
ncbi:MULTISPECIES: hypothetical protein [Yersinia]|nr:hypothetical protein [Yersinia kristensenii]MBW5842230.1 hypothetical protein [Yersinia kristensenii]